LAAAPTIAHAATLRTVALSGQQAPGTLSGVNFSFSGTNFPFTPVLNDAGQIAFRAGLRGSSVDTTNNEGVWSEGSGSLALVARTGSPAPGTDYNFDEIFDSGAGPVLNEAGQIAFTARAALGSGCGWGCLWSNGSGSLTNLASHDSYIHVLNDVGRIVFASPDGIWSDRSGSLASVARLGDSAPETLGNFNDFAPGLNYPSLNDASHVAFWAGTTVGSGVWSDRSGSLAPVARTGQQAPGMPNGVTFLSFARYPALNDADQIAFRADTSDGDGIWSDASGSLALVTRKGDRAPGTPDGVNYSGFGSAGTPLLNNHGHSLFCQPHRHRRRYNKRSRYLVGGFRQHGIDRTQRESRARHSCRREFPKRPIRWVKRICWHQR
jgi:hypothetical protein